MIGQTISRYKITEKLGEGGMGVVYKAEDTKLGRVVALKFLKAEALDDQEAKKRFLREARAAAALDHSNVCAVHDIDEEHGQTFLAMAFVEGESIREKLAQRPLPLDEAFDYAIQAARGLQCAHAKGIVHRDIKSANLMVTPQGQVKIMDFGLAQLADQSRITKTATFLGTPAYMSPEQAERKPTDARTDIWSLGVVLYEMLSGRLPFKGENEHGVLYGIVNSQPEPLTALRVGLPVELDRILAKAMTKKPTGRYQHVEDLLVDLQALATTGSSSASVTVSPPGTRRRWLVAAGGGAALATVGLWRYGDRLLAPGPGGQITSIAVLPLDNLSGDPEQEYFSDGLTEALIADLSRIGALKVISRTSVMTYKGSTKPLPEIARELGVDAVLEGSVQKEGNRIRVTTQLIEAATDRHLWANTYNRALESVLELQSEVARSVAQQIQVQLSPAESSRLAGAVSINPAAYENYLRGLSHLSAGSPAGIQTAMTYFNQSIDEDPDSALGYAGRASVHLLSFIFGMARPHDAGPRGIEAAQRAIELDPSFADGYVALGRLKRFYDWDWTGAESAFDVALEYSGSNVNALSGRAHMFTCIGREREAELDMQRALDLDPLNIRLQESWGSYLLFLRRFEDSIKQIDSVLAREPKRYMSYLTLWSCYQALGRYDEAYQAFLGAWQSISDETIATVLQQGHAAGGYSTSMLAAGRALAERAKTVSVMQIVTAMTFDFGGDSETALQWIERAHRTRDHAIAYFNRKPFSEKVTSNPRYRKLLRDLNLPL